MKRLLTHSSTLFLLLSAFVSQAQSFKNAGEYMSYIGAQNEEITKDYLSYTSAVAHSKKARKIENRRKELIQSVKDAGKKVSGMPAFQGDKSYRDSTVAFLKLTYHILTDDYGKILNLEDVAEQSYDAMEAYLLAQDLAQEKSNKLLSNLRTIQKNFANKYDVKILETTNDLEKKVKINNEISAYHRTVYLLFFKSFKQESYLMDALMKKDISGVEQNNNTLIKYSEEALTKLDTMKAFQNDKSLVTACKQVQEFYKMESKETAAIVDFLIKEENFQKMKKSMETKRASDRTKADVDQYNKAIADINKAATSYNAINTKLNNSRNKNLENWNKLSQVFLEKHTPHYK